MAKMKFCFLILAVLITSCNNSAKETSEENDKPSVENKDSAMDTQSLPPTSEKNASDALIESYLAIKNALVEDSGEKASEASLMMLKEIDNFDKGAIEGDRLSEVNDILDDAKEQAEHISENAEKIDHQREHLEILSNDFKDLISIIGTGRTLYQQFCPDYNNGKGAMWLSASSKISNPYFGSKMPECGIVQEEIPAK